MEYIIALGIGLLAANNKETIMSALGAPLDFLQVNSTVNGPFDKKAKVPEALRQGKEYSTSSYLSKKYQ